MRTSSDRRRDQTCVDKLILPLWERKWRDRKHKRRYREQWESNLCSIGWGELTLLDREVQLLFFNDDFNIGLFMPLFEVLLVCFAKNSIVLMNKYKIITHETLFVHIYEYNNIYVGSLWEAIISSIQYWTNLIELLLLFPF